jgi:GNAT superfamily N-acetyltransferase
MAAINSSVSFRRATLNDLNVASGIFNRAQNDLYHRCGLARTDKPPAVFTVPQAHVLTHDAKRCFVAESEGTVIAYSSAIERGDTWYLSALFVEPEWQGKGIGRRLFELSAAGWSERRMTIAEAIQPISTGLYASRGLIPSTPVLVFGGKPAIGAPHGLEASAPESSAMEIIDLAVYGFSRAVDHAYWRDQSAGRLWHRQGKPVAYSYVSTSGWIGPVAGLTEQDAAEALRAELAGAHQVMVEIPGSAPLLIETAFFSGLRLASPPGLLLHSRPASLPSSLAISGYWLC